MFPPVWTVLKFNFRKLSLAKCRKNIATLNQDDHANAFRELTQGLHSIHDNTNHILNDANINKQRAPLESNWKLLKNKFHISNYRNNFTIPFHHANYSERRLVFAIPSGKYPYSNPIGDRLNLAYSDICTLSNLDPP